MLKIPGISTTVSNIKLLADQAEVLSSRFEGDDLLIELSDLAADPVNTVIVVETKGSLEVESNMPSLTEVQVVLAADFADIHNPGYGTHAILTGSGEESKITNG